MTAVLWAVWALACVLIAYGCWRAARDYRDEPQPGPRWDADRQRFRHTVPAAPDNVPGARTDWAALCEKWLALPDYDPNHRTTKGD